MNKKTSTGFLISFCGLEQVVRKAVEPRLEKRQKTARDSIGLQIATGEDTFAFGAPKTPRAKRQTRRAALPNLFQ